MTARSTWWRRLGGPWVALVLAVLALGPSLDGLICHDEGRPASSSSSAAVVAAQDVDQPSPAHDDGLGPCVHGHCHHAAPYVPVDAVVAEAAVSPRTRYALAPNAAPTFDLHFELKRPPRA